MADTQKGKAVVWGADNQTFTAGIVEATNASTKESSRIVRSSDKVDYQNSDGDTWGQVFYNQKRSASFTVVPNGGTTAAASLTSAQAYMLTPGTTVTVVDTDLAVTESYNLISATMNRTNTSYATIDLELEAFDAAGIDVTAAIS